MDKQLSNTTHHRMIAGGRQRLIWGKAKTTRRRTKGFAAHANSSPTFVHRFSSLFKTKLWILCITLGAMFWPSGIALAAPLGEMGATSKARVQISVSVAQRLTINGAGILRATDPRSPSVETAAVQFCVEGKTTIGSYSVTFFRGTSQGTTSAHGFAGQPGSCARGNRTNPSSTALSITPAYLESEPQREPLTLIIAAD